MGHLTYGSDTFEIDDRTLLHLQTVITQKLRRHERFMLTLETKAVGVPVVCSLWVSDTAELGFAFAGSRQPRLEHEWLEQMMQASFSSHGLDLRAVARQLSRAG